MQRPFVVDKFAETAAEVQGASRGQNLSLSPGRAAACTEESLPQVGAIAEALRGTVFRARVASTVAVLTTARINLQASF